MSNKLIHALLISITISIISGCARDLSPTTYNSDSTLNIVLQGKLLAKRNVTIKENERLGDNSVGAISGGITGGLIGANNSNNPALAASGAIIGGMTGAVLESALSTSKGIEYIVQIDKTQLANNYYEGSRVIRDSLAAIRTSGIITIIQERENRKNPVINEGDNILIILSDKRIRCVPNKY